METNKIKAYRGWQVDKVYNTTRSTRYAMQDPKSPQYDETWPLPIKLSSRVRVYLVSEIEAWLASRPRVRDIEHEEKAEVKACSPLRDVERGRKAWIDSRSRARHTRYGEEK